MFRRVSLRFKITFLVISVVFGASVLFVNFVYGALNRLLTQASGFGTLAAGVALADTVDQEVLVVQSIAEIPKMHSYQETANRITSAINNGAIEFSYVVKINPATDEITYLISLPESHEASYVQPGTTEPMSLGQVFLAKEPGYQPMLLHDQLYMVAWVPMSTDGHHGVLLVATNLDVLLNEMQTILFAIIAAVLILILLSGLVAYKFATTFEKTAVTDGLMGIYNHKYFKQRLEEEVAKSRRYGQKTSVVLADIDFFKRVNDTYGHATGDLVLKKMAKWVTETARNTDVVCRYGGEELAIILPHTGVAGAQEFGERLRQRVAEEVIHDPEEKVTFRITISIGVAQWEKGINYMDLMKRADAALYNSKNTGRNRVSIFQEEIL